MNPVKIFQLVIGIVSISAFSLASAQPGFVVTARGDTLRGNVVILSNPPYQQVQVKGEKKTTLSITAVKKVVIKDEEYRPIKFESQYKFMRLLKEGYLSLFNFQIGNQLTYDGFYLTKKDGQGIELPNIGFKKVMAQFLSDCPLVADSIKSGKFSRSNYEEVIDRYNSCIDVRTSNAQQTNATIIQQKSKAESVEALVIRISTMEFEGKQDALDVLADIGGKIKNNQTVPNYILQTLKELLATQKSLQEELESFLNAVKK